MAKLLWALRRRSLLLITRPLSCARRYELGKPGQHGWLWSVCEA